MKKKKKKRNILFDGLRSIGRIGETVIVAAQAGVKYATEKPSNAKLMRETFESLGSTYIKLRQFIASTSSLFPREYVEEFQGCSTRRQLCLSVIFRAY